jgi:tight adherence protein B
VQSAAVLMSAGLAPDRVWAYLGVSFEDVASRPEPSWHSFAAGWTVATTVGAPMAQSMRRLALALREGAGVVRDIQASLVGPQSASKMILYLPIAALGLGALLGFNSLEFLLFRPLGWGCLLFSSLLIYSGAKWSTILTIRATPLSWNPGLRAELTAMALGGGASLDRAVGLVTKELGDGMDAGETAAIGRVLALAEDAGVPAAELLRAEAERQRYEARAAGQAGAQRLGIQLLLPLGLCILPAFVLVGVVPLIVSVLSSTSFGF